MLRQRTQRGGGLAVALVGRGSESRASELLSTAARSGGLGAESCIPPRCQRPDAPPRVERREHRPSQRPRPRSRPGPARRPSTMGRRRGSTLDRPRPRPTQCRRPPPRHRCRPRRGRHHLAHAARYRCRRRQLRGVANPRLRRRPCPCRRPPPAAIGGSRTPSTASPPCSASLTAAARWSQPRSTRRAGSPAGCRGRKRSPASSRH